MSYKRNKRKRMKAREKKWPVLFKEGTPLFPLFGNDGTKIASWNFVSRPLPRKRSL